MVEIHEKSYVNHPNLSCSSWDDITFEELYGDITLEQPKSVDFTIENWDLKDRKMKDCIWIKKVQDSG